MTIKMVHRVVILVNSVPHKDSLHSILSLGELITGKKFRYPTIRIGQHIQGIIGGNNDTDKEGSIVYCIYKGLTMTAAILYLS